MLTIESIELLLLWQSGGGHAARRLANCLTRWPWVLGGIVLAWLPFARRSQPEREFDLHASLPALDLWRRAPSTRLAALAGLPVVLTPATLGVVTLPSGSPRLEMHYWAQTGAAGRPCSSVC